MKAGEVYPHGNPMDSVALAEHVLGQKQYEIVNHLSNVQEVITDKKYWKDKNGDGNRDEAKAVVQSVYDYYPFGQLMAGRSVLDTVGMCVTHTRYQEIPVYKWVPGAGMSIGGNVSSEGGTSLTASGSGGVDVYGTGGGIRYEINNITAHAIQLRTYFSMLSGTATITIWQGTTVGTGGTQLGSTTSSFTSPAPVINTSVGGTTTVPKTITVVVSMGTGSSRSLFSVDSIGYQTFSWTVATGIYTTCGEPKDHYEFGYNGQMKSNEIAGMGNHNTALFWEYDTRLGRRWNRDPRPMTGQSMYGVFQNNPIFLSDALGDTTRYFNILTNRLMGEINNSGAARDVKVWGEGFAGALRIAADLRINLSEEANANRFVQVFERYLEQKERTDKTNLIAYATGELSLRFSGAYNTKTHLASGTLRLCQNFDDGSTRNLSDWPVLSGTLSKGKVLFPLPNRNDYVGTGVEARPQNSGFQRHGISYVIMINDFPRTPTWNRGQFRIHPDGRNPGSAGCIALQSEKAELIRFRGLMNQYFQSHQSMNIRVNIEGNPNVGWLKSNEPGRKKVNSGE